MKPKMKLDWMDGLNKHLRSFNSVQLRPQGNII